MSSKSSRAKRQRQQALQNKRLKEELRQAKELPTPKDVPADDTAIPAIAQDTITPKPQKKVKPYTAALQHKAKIQKIWIVGLSLCCGVLLSCVVVLALSSQKVDENAATPDPSMEVVNRTPTDFRINDVHFSKAAVDVNTPSWMQTQTEYLMSPDFTRYDGKDCYINVYKGFPSYADNDAFEVAVSDYVKTMQSALTNEGDFVNISVVEDTPEFRAIDGQSDNGDVRYSLYLDKDGVQEAGLSCNIPGVNADTYDWSILQGLLLKYLGIDFSVEDLTALHDLAYAKAQATGGNQIVMLLSPQEMQQTTMVAEVRDYNTSTETFVFDTRLLVQGSQLESEEGHAHTEG